MISIKGLEMVVNYWVLIKISETLLSYMGICNSRGGAMFSRGEKDSRIQGTKGSRFKVAGSTQCP